MCHISTSVIRVRAFPFSLIVFQINHNWFNSTNCSSMWEFLKLEYKNVQEEISHLETSMLETDGPDSFKKHCNFLLKTNCGLDVPGFLKLVLDGVSSASFLLCGCNKEEDNPDCMISSGRQFINLKGVCEVLRDALLCDFELYPLKTEDISDALGKILEWGKRHPTEPPYINSETS